MRLGRNRSQIEPKITPALGGFRPLGSYNVNTRASVPGDAVSCTACLADPPANENTNLPPLINSIAYPPFSRWESRCMKPPVPATAMPRRGFRKGQPLRCAGPVAEACLPSRGTGIITSAPPSYSAPRPRRQTFRNPQSAIRNCPSLLAAFTLMELLVVVAIISVLAIVSLPNIISTGRSMQLTQAGQLVETQLQVARQRALANNRSVEVRFYSLGTSGTAPFTAIQPFFISTSGTSATPADKPYYLPGNMIRWITETPFPPCSTSPRLRPGKPVRCWLPNPSAQAGQTTPASPFDSNQTVPRI